MACRTTLDDAIKTMIQSVWVALLPALHQKCCLSLQIDGKEILQSTSVYNNKMFYEFQFARIFALNVWHSVLFKTDAAYTCTKQLIKPVLS